MIRKERKRKKNGVPDQLSPFLHILFHFEWTTVRCSVLCWKHKMANPFNASTYALFFFVAPAIPRTAPRSDLRLTLEQHEGSRAPTTHAVKNSCITLDSPQTTTNGLLLAVGWLAVDQKPSWYHKQSMNTYSVSYMYYILYSYNKVR